MVPSASTEGSYFSNVQVRLTRPFALKAELEDLSASPGLDHSRQRLLLHRHRVSTPALRPFVSGPRDQAHRLVCGHRPPGRDWVTQQARNLVREPDRAGNRVLIHDHDAKCAGSADGVVEPAGLRVIKTPIAPPRSHAHMERLIGSGRRESWIGC